MKSKENTTYYNNSHHHLDELLTYLKLRPLHFAKSIGLERADNIYHVLKGRNGISNELAKLIISKYPDVNYSWLLTGEGKMLKEETNKYEINNSRAQELLTEHHRGEVLSTQEIMSMLVLQNEKLINIIARHSVTIENLSIKVNQQDTSSKNAKGEAS